jgi:hypothetical protein
MRDCKGVVLSFGASIGMPPVGCGVSRPITYQNDISFHVWEKVYPMESGFSRKFCTNAYT